MEEDSIRLLTSAVRTPGPADPACPEEVTDGAVGRLSPDCDELFRQVTARHPITVIKDQTYLNWRYADHPDTSYELLEARECNGVLLAVAVLRHGWCDEPVPALCELVLRPHPAFPGLVRYLEGRAREDGSPQLRTPLRPGAPLGGLGVFPGLHTGMAAAGLYDAGLAWATGVVFLLGLWDDIREVAPPVRLAVEAAAGVLMSLAADLPGQGFGIRLFAVVLVVAAINAVNLFDGLDGLVGSAAVVSGIGLGGLAEVRGADGYYGLVAAAAAAGVLMLNWRPARLFLGDNGG